METICPLLSIGKDSFVYCNEKCSSFCREEHKCAIPSINTNLNHLEDIDKAVTAKA